MNSKPNLKYQQFSWKVSQAFFDKIENHLFDLQNHLNKKVFKKNWMLEAIKEKLKKKNISLNTYERISFKIDMLTKIKLNQKVNEIRKFQEGYTKKELILDAIKEQLSREDEYIKEQFKEQRQILNELKNGLK